MTLARWRRTCAPPTTSVRDIAQILTNTGERVALIVDDQDTLLGTVTDGDLRRALLAELPPQTPVSGLMNPRPRTAPAGTPPDHLRRWIFAESLICLPLIAPDGRLVDVEFAFGDDHQSPHDDVHAVIMAGGRGSRLRPLTDATPKPLLPVNGQPILEHILRRMRDSGIETVHLAVNYRGEQIHDHFGDGSALGLSLHYLTEEQPLGTAGALSLLVNPPPLLLVSNADILTDLDYTRLITAHRSSGVTATACVREHVIQVPYGVATTHDGHLTDLTEKPHLTHSVLAGIYLLNRSTLVHLPHGQYTDMPDHLRTLLDAGHPIAAHPITGLWIDIGDHDSYARAQAHS